jgi:COP9 signalosome complex subunit 5
MGDHTMALARWELENSVQIVDDTDALFRYNAAEDRAIQLQKPWTKDPHFFKQ